MGNLTSSGDRRIRYMRVSVTDRCDMRCVYCMPAAGMEFIPRRHLLTDDEIVRVVSVAAALGIHKVRYTGGEPLVRPGVVGLVRRTVAVPGISEVALSTNAGRLADHAAGLADAGLRRVNISLDSLRPDRFAMVTRGGRLDRTLAGIAAAEAAGLTPIKVNCVVMRGLNDDEVPDLARMAAGRGWQVRFIEYMPVGWAADRWQEQYVPAGEILAALNAVSPLEPLPGRPGDPARLYRLGGTTATVGVITPVSQHFCDSCNRLRLTADGRIRSCLLQYGEVNIREMLRNGCTDSEIGAALQRAADMKPDWHGIVPGEISTVQGGMNEVGG